MAVVVAVGYLRHPCQSLTALSLKVAAIAANMFVITLLVVFGGEFIKVIVVVVVVGEAGRKVLLGTGRVINLVTAAK